MKRTLILYCFDLQCRESSYKTKDDTRCVSNRQVPDTSYDLGRSHATMLTASWKRQSIETELPTPANPGEDGEAPVEGVVLVPLGFVSDHMEVKWDLTCVILMFFAIT